MDILFLDDSQTRHDFFCKKKHNKDLRWKPHVCTNEICRVTHVYTAEQAIQQIKKQSFDIISLDYDLSVADTDSNNGFTVAQYLVSHFTPYDILSIFIHSWNIKKSEAMCKFLSNNKFNCFSAPFYVA